MAVDALLVSGCLTGRGNRSQVHHERSADLDSMIESAVNDRSTWVDPDGAL
jgi:hypothetical protein